MKVFFKNRSGDSNHRISLIGSEVSSNLEIPLSNQNIVKAGDALAHFCLGPAAAPATFSATYDGFLQTMTVTGNVGEVVETKDALGFLLGGGTIPESGTLSYTINEDSHDRSVPIFTKASTSDAIEHQLIVSFYAEMGAASIANNGFNPWGMFAKGITQRDGQSNNAWDNVAFDENDSGRVHVQWKWGELESIKIYTLEEIRTMFTVRYGADFYPDDSFYGVTDNPANASIKVRFDLDSTVVLGLACTDTIHKFYDDGTANRTIGYRFGLDFGGGYPLRKVPTYLPKSVKNLDFMFASAGLQMFENEAGASNLNLWDVSHIVTMNSTFAETDDPVIPISLWRPVNVTSMARFISGSACNGLGVSSVSDWRTPLLININEAFIQRYNNSKYFSDLSMWCIPLITEEPALWHSGQMIPPVWGTCPS